MSKHSVALLLAALLQLSLTGCSRQDAVEKTTRPSVRPPSDSVQLSPAAIDRFGLRVVPVEAREQAETITTTGEIKSDENSVFHINSLSGGRVIADKVMLGDLIHSGQVLGVVQNLEVAKVYGNYIHEAHQNEVDVHLEETKLALAQKNYDRLRTLFKEGIAAEKDVIKAESDLRLAEETVRGLKEHARHIMEEAKSLLSAYGVPLNSINSEHIESSSPIIAPRGGVIVKKTVTVGDVVSSSEPLYVVADLGTVWLDIAVYDKQLQSIKPGDRVTFKSDSVPNRNFTGQIDYIKPSTAEDNSGTFVARAVLKNADMQLKPGMLGAVCITITGAMTQPFVPEKALQKYGKETFVFVDEGKGRYQKVDIELGPQLEDGYLVTSGLHSGEKIVSDGSFTLKAELLKSNLAGDD